MYRPRLEAESGMEEDIIDYITQPEVWILPSQNSVYEVMVKAEDHSADWEYKSQLEKLTLDHPVIFKDHILSYLQNVIQPSTTKLIPSEHIFKIGMLNKLMNRTITKEYGEMKPQTFSKYLGVSRGIYMFESIPRCLEDDESQRLNLEMQKMLRAWRSEFFGGSVLDPVKFVPLQL